jgi:hypothetical protein
MDTIRYLDSLAGPTDKQIKETEKWIKKEKIEEEIRDFDSLRKEIETNILDRGL